MNSTFKKGFTLVELLIVIGILAVLATTAVVILNPAQLLAQARDSQRLSDLASIQSALALYQTDVSIGSQDLNGGGVNTALCATTRAATAGTYQAVTVAAANRSFTGTTEVIDATREPDGNGWIPVDFTDISGGSPLSSIPVDPSNTDPFVYRYACDNPVAGATPANYELNACLESEKYKPLMTNDGGDDNDNTNTTGCLTDWYYEIGTDSGLNL